jgi:hypothetical protein
MRPYLEKRRMYDLSRRELLFYSLFETGPFLLAPYKVVWKEISTTLSCAVQEPINVNGHTSVVIPDHKLVVVPFEEREPAYFLCAALNSSISRYLAATYIIGTQIGTHILEHLKVPLFDASVALHQKIARLSEDCHKAVANGDVAALSKHEEHIDRLIATLLQVSDEDVQSMKAALSDKESSSSKNKKIASEDEDD